MKSSLRVTRFVLLLLISSLRGNVRSLHVYTDKTKICDAIKKTTKSKRRRRKTDQPVGAVAK